ncbi:MAG: trypsin-like peptidase domain-containing protein [Flavipsychrobacter sp.]|nr:trypsin-like peptidase domain-containing protein [Flavipsychrobacter sp.]
MSAYNENIFINMHATIHVNDDGSMLKNSHGQLVAPETSIFPLVSYNIGEQRWICLGTGFFVDGRGGFVTARHVFYDNGLDGKHVDTLYAVQSLPNGDRILRSITHFSVHRTADIAFGYLGYARNHLVWSYMTPLASAFCISKNALTVGDSIVNFGFPRTTDEDINNDRQVFTFKGRWESGKVVDFHPEGMGHFHKKEGVYQTTMRIDSGASGGPVMRENIVVGVNSVGIDVANDEEPISGVVPISYLHDIELKGPGGRKMYVGDLVKNGTIPSL